MKVKCNYNASSIPTSLHYSEDVGQGFAYLPSVLDPLLFVGAWMDGYETIHDWARTSVSEPHTCTHTHAQCSNANTLWR